MWKSHGWEEEQLAPGFPPSLPEKWKVGPDKGLYVTLPVFVTFAPFPPFPAFPALPACFRPCSLPGLFLPCPACAFALPGLPCPAMIPGRLNDCSIVTTLLRIIKFSLTLKTSRIQSHFCRIALARPAQSGRAGQGEREKAQKASGKHSRKKPKPQAGKAYLEK